jgi:hypothetical protein
MRFSGNQPRIMQFGRVKNGDHYAVRPEATLGPTQGGTREVRAEKTRVKEASNQEAIS